MSEILFLCTGNYYRSRFAQAIFNAGAEQRGLSWRAFSRGLWLQPEVNPGVLSIHTDKALKQLGIPLHHAGDEPRPLTREDLQRASRVIALKEAEHLPLMQRDFPDYADCAEYWTVHDLDAATPEEALPQIHAKVLAILDQLEKEKT